MNWTKKTTPFRATTTMTSRPRPGYSASSSMPLMGRLAPLGCVLAFVLALSVLGVVAQTSAMTNHTYTYGQTLTLELELPDAADGSQVESNLYVSINGDQTTGYEVPLNDGRGVYEHNLQSSPLPPFAEITYWWEYPASDGDLVSTNRTTFRYEDNRYEWQSIEEDPVRIHWISGEGPDMISALDIARSSLSQITDVLQAPLPHEIDVYIYPSARDLATAMRLTSHPWVSGVAYPQLGVVLLAIPPTDEAVLAMQRDIPHEMTHEVLYTLLGSQGYISLPTWLSEGLATYFQLRPTPEYDRLLKEASGSGALIPLTELCLPFPEDHSEALLAYAQSASLVSYLRQNHGWSRIRDLLDTYADGMSCNAGTKEALGMDLNQLERAWRMWLEQADEPPSTFEQARINALLFLRDTAPWILLVSVLLLPTGLAIIVKRR
ncbi:MAG: peptidase MA family metallohydrolase [Anaerolineae bacterium]